LYDYGARWYDPQIGRFISPDIIIPNPANPQSFNRYAYVKNNPVKYSDPSGHCGVDFNYGQLFTNPAACVMNIIDNDMKAINAFKEGERRPLVLASHAYGVTDLVVEKSEAINQLNEDADVVFSNAPVEERLMPSVRLGLWATEQAALAVGTAQIAKAGGQAIRASSNTSNLPVKYDPEFAYRQGANPQTVVPDSYYVVRGGQSPMPPQGTTFSGSMGSTVNEAGIGVPHGSIRTTTAGQVRSGGGIVEFAPEPTRSGTMNFRHVNITEQSSTVFGDIIKNPVPKVQRIQ
jgi:hypothetical protein